MRRMSVSVFLASISILAFAHSNSANAQSLSPREQALLRKYEIPIPSTIAVRLAAAVQQDSQRSASGIRRRDAVEGQMRKILRTWRYDSGYPCDEEIPACTQAALRAATIRADELMEERNHKLLIINSVIFNETMSPEQIRESLEFSEGRTGKLFVFSLLEGQAALGGEGFGKKFFQLFIDPEMLEESKAADRAAYEMFRAQTAGLPRSKGPRIPPPPPPPPPPPSPARLSN